MGYCKRHGGATATHKRSAEKELARRECVSLGIPIEVHPAEALLGEVFRARGNVEFYERLVQELPTHPGPDEFVPPEGDGSGYWLRGEPGVYGRTYHVSGIPTGEGKPHVLVQLYNEERRQLAAVCAAALKAGVDERRIKMAEQEGHRIATFGRRLCEEFGIDPSSEKARGVFRRLLTDLGAEG